MSATLAPGRRIGLLSDTHGWLDPRLRNHLASCDEIWHAGDIGGLHITDEIRSWYPDKPLRAIVGNIDDAASRRAFPTDLRFELDGGPRMDHAHRRSPSALRARDRQRATQRPAHPVRLRAFPHLPGEVR